MGHDYESATAPSTLVVYAKKGNHIKASSKNTIAFRPRLLYSTIFVWSTITVGKFTAPLLQQLSPRFSDSMIGMTFALQYAIVACLGGWGGSLADSQERNSLSWGWGRCQVLSLALTLGTLAFLGHGLPEYAKDVFPDDSTVVLVWHISMRCIYAVSMGVFAPTLDGLALAHLDAIEGASSLDFGKERMYGAFWWGAGSLAVGMGIDYYGFDFLYAFLGITTLASYISIILYLWGLSRDTTGAFDSHDDGKQIDEGGAYRMSEYQLEEAIMNSTHEKEEDVISNMELLCMVFKTGYGRAFLFFAFVLAMGISVVDNLAFIFFDTLGASKTMDGWTVVFTVIIETPVFYVAPMLLKRFGPGQLLLAAGVAYVIRIVGYTFVPDGKMYIVLLLETLHGISYAGSKTGSVEFIASIMPDGYEASGQGILILITYFGIVAGLMFAGWIQETLGARVMFRAMATIVSVGIIVLLLAERFYDEEHQRTDAKRLETKETNGFDEKCRLMKSESCASSASAFADNSTEGYIRKLKYDSLNKYVKDWED